MLLKIRKSIVSTFQDIDEYYEYYSEDGNVLKKYMWEKLKHSPKMIYF
jgi:hypothetical protein